MSIYDQIMYFKFLKIDSINLRSIIYLVYFFAKAFMRNLSTFFCIMNAIIDLNLSFKLIFFR